MKMVKVVKGAHYPQLYAEGAVQYQHSNPEVVLDGTIYYGVIGFKSRSSKAE